MTSQITVDEDYVVTSADNGAVINLVGTAQHTVSWGAPASYSTTHRNEVINRSNAMWLIVVDGYADALKLFPGQSGIVQMGNAGWWRSPQQRYRKKYPVLFCAPNGLSTNDGLTIDRPLRHPQQGIDVALYDIDSAGTAAVVDLADNSLVPGGEYAPFNILADPLGANQIQIFGNDENPEKCIIARSSAGDIGYFKDKGIGTIYGVWLRPYVNGVTCLRSGAGGVGDFGYCIFGHSPLGNHCVSEEGGEINVVAPYSVVGDAIHHIASINGGKIYAGDGNITCAIYNTPTFTDFALASEGGRIKANGPVNYVGAVAASTRKFLAQYSGGITRNGTVFPGGVSGFADPATFGTAAA